jgi:sugar lactone lactonase YvrE
MTLVVTTINAQWEAQGAFPDTSVKGGTHGIAVDPDGKVWVSSYYQDIPWIPQEGDTINTAGILVFNPDGTEASFSPIVTVTTGGGSIVDTLHGACRGMSTDENGNIVYVQSGPAKGIKINYQTGEAMAVALLPETGSSPTQAGVADDGTIFIGPVVGGGTNAIAMYDTDFNYIGNAVVGPPDIARVLEVSADGNTIYWMPFTGSQQIWIYERPDEFSEFALKDTLYKGMSIETCDWNPKTGKLWVSNDVRGPDSTKSHLTWYELDLAGGVGQSFTWQPNTDETEFPRGFAFAPDGNTAYAGTFTVNTPRMQKFAYVGLKIPSTWTNNGAFPDTSVKGGTHGIAVDPDGKVWVSSYYKDIPWVPAEGDTILTSGILVFNPDGTEASFSPIVTVTTGGGFIVDTLHGDCRGMSTDENGNIVYVQSGPAKGIKINYQTGEGMAVALLPETGSSPTQAGVSDDGTISIGPVVGGGTTAIAMYDTDFNYMGNAVVGPPDIARTMTVSADGNTIYWMPFTGSQQIWIYERPDEFSEFALKDTMFKGMSIETCDWNPATGKLWVSNDVRGANKDLKHLTWYELDLNNETWTDSFSWDNLSDETEFPRGFAFAPDGKTAYMGSFTTFTPRMQKATQTGTGVWQVSGLVPDGYLLEQNYPNPFNPTTMITFSIPKTEKVTIKVYNLLGQEIATLLNEVKVAGSYEVDFNASKLASGMYVYTIYAGKYSASRKMMFLK